MWSIMHIDGIALRSVHFTASWYTGSYIGFSLGCDNNYVAFQKHRAQCQFNLQDFCQIYWHDQCMRRPIELINCGYFKITCLYICVHHLTTILYTFSMLSYYNKWLPYRYLEFFKQKILGLLLIDIIKILRIFQTVIAYSYVCTIVRL